MRKKFASSPLDLDDGGAGGRAVKVACSLSLASLGDSPAVRRDALPKSSEEGASGFVAAWRRELGDRFRTLAGLLGQMTCGRSRS